MKKIMWRISRAGISAVLVGGALLAAGGSATAATSQADARVAHHHPDPWVAGQLAMFDPWITDQLAMFDPWISDQLAMFAPSGSHVR
ncbi:hypothetical protein [Streptomyces sp. NPDC048191]|uniref:hypothetical protein n=1 Tax=Streptomyces sp. NPDC048191 TaxID=3155484 RepID=UPI0033CF6336